MKKIVWFWLLASLTACGSLVAEARMSAGEEALAPMTTAASIPGPAQAATLMPVEPSATPDDATSERTRPVKPRVRPRLPVSSIPAGVSHSPPLDPALETLVQAAQDDLARRQGSAPKTITRVEVRSVVWSDGSLGCPRPGVAYPQGQVDGLFVRFKLGGRNFDYHGGNGRALFLCDRKPSGSRLAPSPGDDS